MDFAVDSDLTEAGSRGCLLLEQLVVFGAGSQRYGLPIDQVAEIQQIVEFAPAPSAARGLLGMLDLRGQVIPALDGRTLLDEEHTELHVNMPMIVCRTASGLAAIVVDSVHDVLVIPPGCIQDPPHLHAHASEMIGVARVEDGLVYVLDADRVLEGALA